MMPKPTKTTILHVTFLVYLLWQVFLPNFVQADFTGKVVGVSDGDTLTIKYKKLKVKVRLQNIDAPERGQPYADASKNMLKALVLHKKVTLRGNEQMDQYNRALGVVELDGLNINAMMVEMGWAWVYTRYNTDESLKILEAKARHERRGLWQQSDPTKPWVWRSTRQKTKKY